MKTKLIMGVAVLVCLAGTLPRVEAAVTNYVDGARTGLSDNSGQTWENAFTNLQEAIGIATTNTDLWVAQGTYYPTNGFSASAVTNCSFMLKPGMNLYGGFTNGMNDLEQRDWMEYAAILSGDIDRNGLLDTSNSVHVLILTNNVKLDGLHFMYGYSTSTIKAGAAIYGPQSTYSNAIIRNCVFAQNQPFVSTSINNGGSVAELTGYTVVSNCIFMANNNSSLCSLIHINYVGAKNTTIRNCLFLQNGAGAVIYRGSTPCENFSIVNSTFFKNKGFALFAAGGGFTWTASNCIFWGNGGTLTNSVSPAGTVSYCDIQGGLVGVSNVTDGVGNIDADPLFVGGPTGSWTVASFYESSAFRTTLTDTNAGFGSLRGKFLNPKMTSTNCFYILSSNPTQIVVRGKADVIGAAGNVYEVLDAHERSNSPCIDAGNPADAYALEPNPNGSRINMGAYGNTPQAACRASAGMLIRVY